MTCSGSGYDNIRQNNIMCQHECGMEPTGAFFCYASFGMDTLSVNAALNYFFGWKMSVVSSAIAIA